MEIPFLDKLDLSPELKERLADIAETDRVTVVRFDFCDPTYMIKIGDFSLTWERYPDGVTRTNAAYGTVISETGLMNLHRDDGAAAAVYHNGVIKLQYYCLDGKEIDPDEVRGLLGETPINFTPEQAMLFNLTFGGK